MTNLVQSLGTNYFNRRFGGSFFRDDEGRASIVRQAGGNEHVDYVGITGSATRINVTQRSLPWDFFSDLKLFAVPTLGWRGAAQGKYLAYYERQNRSYQRGLSNENLTIYNSPLTRWLISTKNFSMTLAPEKRCFMAMNPEFIPFTEGIRQMRDGSLLSFAASSTVAVIPDLDDTFAIYFKTQKAGVVNADNSISITVPALDKYLETVA